MARNIRSRQSDVKLQRKGIALLEVIIGATLLGIGLAVVISLSSRALAAQTEGEKRLQAAWLADELLTMVMVEGPREYSRIYDTTGRFEEPFSEFTFNVEIDDVDLDRLYYVSATVSWPGRSGERSAHVETYIAQRQYDEEGILYELMEERIPLEPIDRDARWYGEDDY